MTASAPPPTALATSPEYWMPPSAMIGMPCSSAVWEQPSRMGSEGAGNLPSRIGEDTITVVQTKLRTAGLYNGPVDGIVGPRTSEAIERYQSQAGLQQSGRLDQPTLAKLIDVEGTQNAMNPEQRNGGTAAGTTQQ